MIWVEGNKLSNDLDLNRRMLATKSSTHRNFFDFKSEQFCNFKTSQKNRLLEYIEFQNKRESNWGTLVDIYCDEGKSAKNMKGSPELLRMLTDVKLGRINLIVASELSRLNRNIKDFCEVWDLLKDHKASFVTLRENFDTTTVGNGAREPQVEEPLSCTKLALFEFEVDEVAEPKCLSSDQLRTLIQRCGTYVKTANSLGTSEAFIRQNTKQRNFKTKVRY